MSDHDSHDRPGGVEQLKPQLRHNREAWEGWGRRKVQLLVVTVVVGVLAGIFLGLIVPVPEDVIVAVMIALFVVAGLGVGYVEVKRLVIFRHDLRERRDEDGA